jgi:hypothetical protein
MLLTAVQGNDFAKNLLYLLKKGATIKILIDDVDLDVMALVKESNKANVGNNQIQFGYTNKLGNIGSLTIISD